MEKESKMKSKEELISRVLELFKTLGHNRMRYQKEPWQNLDRTPGAVEEPVSYPYQG